MQTLWALIWAQVVVAAPILGWWILGTGLVNLLAHRSQVNAWCEVRPKLAGLFKLTRSLGFDPWLLIQGATLWVKGRLPERLRYALPVFLVAFLFGGCTMGFEEARVSSLRSTSPRGDVLSQRCHRLDDRRQLWGGVAKGAAVVAGGAGIATIPAEGRGARIGLAAGGVGAAAVAAGAVYVAELAGQSWAEECSQ